MKKNIGPFDQWLRAAIGFILLVLAGTGTIGVWGYIGVIPLVTAMVGYCPLYRVLRVDTLPGVRKST